MLIDLIAFVLLCLALFKGIRKGLVVALFSFLGFIVGIAAALKLSTLVAGMLGESISISERWLPALAFVLVFIVVVLLVRLGARLVEGALQMVLLGWLNRLGGVLFYALIYFFLFSVLLFYAGQLQLVKGETLAASVVYPWIQPIGPAIINVMGTVFPFLRDVFEELLNFFDKAPDSIAPAENSGPAKL